MRTRLTSLFLTAGIIGLAGALLIYILKPALLSRILPPNQVIMQVASNKESQRVARHPLVSFAEAVQYAAPAVVNIASTKVVAVDAHPFLNDPTFRQFFGDNVPSIPRRQMERSLGSGVLVSADGYILTNAHVVAAAQEIEVGLHDGRTAKGRLVGSDPESDLAVLKVDLGNLPHIVLGHSRNIQVGDVVLAIGNPFAVGQTVTMGIVSALGRSQLGINAFEDFIQTDAAINPGNSGGALVDTHGNLVGINTAIFSREGGGSLGIGFAIPVDLAARVMKQLIETGHVTRGWLGVGAQDLDPALASSFGLAAGSGALVTAILPESPAAQAQLQPGDVIVEIDGKPLRDAKELLNRIADYKPGSKITLTIVRQGNKMQKAIRVGVRPPPPPIAEVPSEALPLPPAPPQ
ncbi:MAG: Do family serine endopeptidase [Pseudomonadota bacterium]|uniref:Do family serine endopeptidase n=1 Tax=Thermithiobacillus tepidarius TaxID=929 RepID=UPI000425FDE3|nr:Do family serine endopeptidase [Thermithiobacillus tepidarius]